MRAELNMRGTENYVPQMLKFPEILTVTSLFWWFKLEFEHTPSSYVLGAYILPEFIYANKLNWADV